MPEYEEYPKDAPAVALKRGGEIAAYKPVPTSGAYSDVTGTPTLGTAAALNVGTGANNIPQLDSNGKLGAIDGSNLTGVSAFSFASTLAFE